jgi:hypothetical protein
VPEHWATSDKRGLLWHLSIGCLRKTCLLFLDSAGSSTVSSAETVILCESSFERWLEIEIGRRLWLVKRGLIVFVPSRLSADFLVKQRSATQLTKWGFIVALRSDGKYAQALFLRASDRGDLTATLAVGLVLFHEMGIERDVLKGCQFPTK